MPDQGRAARAAASRSWYSVPEVHAAVSLMDAIDAAAPATESRVVLTPYREQREALESAAGLRAQRYGGNWAVATVDSFQGREAQHAVLSLVRAGGGAGFMVDGRRANVMLSRGMGRLMVLGDWSAWAAESCSAPLLRRFAQRFPPALSMTG